MADHENQSRLIARLLREVLRDESCETLADLVDLLKMRCAKLRIPYPAQAVSEALALVGSNRELVADPRKGLVSRTEPRLRVFDKPLDPPRDEAAKLHAELMKQFTQRKPTC